VTAGARDAWLFSRGGTWRFSLPPLEGLLNPIGAGDCCSAVLLSRILDRVAVAPAPPESPRVPSEVVVEAFAEALACASASCLGELPGAYDPADTASLLPHVESLNG
jgi:fructose-1-phosphate kinase PfkB-like protein